MSLNDHEQELWDHAIQDAGDTPLLRALADPELRRLAKFTATHDGEQKYDDPDALTRIQETYGFDSRELLAVFETAMAIADDEIAAEHKEKTDE